MFGFAKKQWARHGNDRYEILKEKWVFNRAKKKLLKLWPYESKTTPTTMLRKQCPRIKKVRYISFTIPFNFLEKFQIGRSEVFLGKWKGD